MHHFFFSRKQKQYAAGLLTAMLLLEHTLLSPFTVQAAVPSVHGDSEVSAEASFPSAFLSGENVSFVSFPSRFEDQIPDGCSEQPSFGQLPLHGRPPAGQWQPARRQWYQLPGRHW